MLADVDSSPLTGARATVLATADQTGDAWEALELELGPGARSPLHTLAAVAAHTREHGVVILPA